MAYMRFGHSPGCVRGSGYRRESRFLGIVEEGNDIRSPAMLNVRLSIYERMQRCLFIANDACFFCGRVLTVTST
jgi:hypothetical protein